MKRAEGFECKDYISHKSHINYKSYINYKNRAYHKDHLSQEKYNKQNFTTIN